MGQAKTKLKGCRPLEQINVEYSMACGQLGDYTYRRGMLAKEIEKLQTRLGELDLEASEAKAQEAEKPLEPGIDARPQSASDDALGSAPSDGGIADSGGL